MRRYPWFLPSHLLPFHSVPLATLISNPKAPHKDHLPPSSPPNSTNEVLTIPIPNLHLLLTSTSSSSPLNFRLTRLLSFTHSSTSGANHKLLADQGYVHELVQPKKIFRRCVLERKEAKDYMQGAIEAGEDTWFVVGVKTVVDGRVEYGIAQSRNNTMGSDIPLLSPVLVGGEISNLGDVGVSGGSKEEVKGNAGWDAPGEQIFAVCYRKVKFRRKFVNRKKVEEAWLRGDDSWWVLLPTDRDLIPREDIEVVEAELEGEEEEEEDEGLRERQEGEQVNAEGREEEWGMKRVEVAGEEWLIGNEGSDDGDGINDGRM